MFSNLSKRYKEAGRDSHRMLRAYKQKLMELALKDGKPVNTSTAERLCEETLRKTYPKSEVYPLTRREIVQNCSHRSISGRGLKFFLSIQPECTYPCQHPVKLELDAVVLEHLRKTFGKSVADYYASQTYPVTFRIPGWVNGYTLQFGQLTDTFVDVFTKITVMHEFGHLRYMKSPTDRTIAGWKEKIRVFRNGNKDASVDDAEDEIEADESLGAIWDYCKYEIASLNKGNKILWG